MGERKGQNKYYPPDFDYKKHGNLNRYHGTHALRDRAAKLGQGILTIRFEMPFNIWCLGCHNHVGMGVRYNAEKKKNFDYDLVEGCSRQEKRYDPSTIDQLGAVDRSFSQKLAADSMFKVEHEDQDRKKKDTVAKDVENLEWLQERMRDDFAANSALRRDFRRQKKDLNEQRAKDAALIKRGSNSIKLVPEDPEDEKVASMVTRYRTVKTFEERQEEKRAEIDGRPILSPDLPSISAQSQSSKDKLKLKISRLRHKEMNDRFTSKSVPPEKKINLGIVRKMKKEPSEDGFDSPASHPLFSTEVEKKEEPWTETEKKAPPACRSLVADYSDSSEEDT